MIPFYFDYLSPYAFLAWRRLHEVSAQSGVRFSPHPVVFAAILQRCGQLGPAEIPAKRRFVIRDCMRHAARHGLKMTYPKTHPFRSLDALRLSSKSVVGERQEDVVEAFFSQAWEAGEDLSDRAVLEKTLERLGLDASALMEKIAQPQAKTALRDATEQALERGVFGVPSFWVGGEVVWGNDRMQDVIALARGDGSIDEAEYEAFVSRPFGVERRRSGA